MAMYSMATKAVDMAHMHPRSSSKIKTVFGTGDCTCPSGNTLPECQSTNGFGASGVASRMKFVAVKSDGRAEFIAAQDMTESPKPQGAGSVQRIRPGERDYNRFPHAQVCTTPEPH